MQEKYAGQTNIDSREILIWAIELIFMIFLWSFSKLKIKARTCQTNNIQWRLHDKSNIYLAFCMGNRASANWILNKKAIYTKSGQKMRKVSSWIITDGRHLFCIQIVLLRLVFFLYFWDLILVWLLVNLWYFYFCNIQKERF